MIASVHADQRSRKRRRRVLVRRRRARLAAVALVAFVAGVVLGAGGGDDGTPPQPKSAAQAATEKARAAVDRLALEQQVGRMVILRFAGTQPPGYVRRVLREGRAAGA